MTGRLVEVRTTFHSEGTKPGGVDRDGAVSAAASVIDGAQKEIGALIKECVSSTVQGLADWQTTYGRSEALSLVLKPRMLRDIAGLVGNKILTDVAALAADALDLVAFEAKTLRSGEATIIAQALTIAERSGSTEKEQATLLRDLKRLVSKIAKEQVAKSV